MDISRRHFVSASLGGCLCCAAPVSLADLLSTNLQPLMGQDYKPADADERGLWQGFGELEQDIAESDLVLPAPDLQAYTIEVVERLIGRPATELRVYIMRDSSFNASMASNGMMIVHTGFLARVHNEAEFAAVIGHEAGHYFRKHSVERWRDRRQKLAITAFVGATAGVASGYSAMQGYNGQSWIDLANSINQALVMSIFSFTRAQEAEADAYGIGLMVNSGYTPQAAGQVWRQLIDERKASAAARDTKYKDHAVSAYSTHPPSADRMVDLTETANEAARRGLVTAPTDRREEWRRTIAPYMPMLLEEQVKLNDPGASLYLIDRHAHEGWTGVLRYYEGEVYRIRNAPGDMAKATQSYSAAISFADAPPEAWKAHGYALVKAGQRDAGHNALNRYLELKPNAKDAAMVRFALGQQP
jgi:beta-barrel assembly-enhancing protease